MKATTIASYSPVVTSAGKGLDRPEVKGKAVTLATGSRAGESLLGGHSLSGQTRAAASSAQPAGRTCVADMYSLLCLGLPMARYSNIVFEDLPTELRRHCNKLKLLKPAEWDMPGFLSKGGSIVEDSCLQIFCMCVTQHDNFILRVHLAAPENTSLHAVAVSGWWRIDPDDNVWRPLSVASFHALNIDRIENGFKVNWK